MRRELAKLLAGCRAWALMSEKDAAHALGITLDVLKKIEAGKEIPSYTMASHMADLYKAQPFKKKQITALFQNANSED